MSRISSFTIQGFRGIKELSVENLNLINLIVGDNNTGKTSILEAIQLLRNPLELINAIRVSKCRDVATLSSGISSYENFILMFPKDENNLSLGVSAVCDNSELSCKIKGETSKIYIDSNEYNAFFHRNLKNSDGIANTESEQFVGVIYCNCFGKEIHNNVCLNSLERVSGMPIKKNECMKVTYVSPVGHLQGGIIGQIVKNIEYKEVCVKALQLFDPDIEDILFVKGINNHPVDCIRHKTLGLMPVSMYGDGIKQVLTLANAVAKSNGGIILIDEIETALHKKYYDDIFRFIVKICRRFEVQAFITTHSIEAVDGLLATQDYGIQKTEDEISVITLKREKAKTYARVMSGRDVSQNREDFGFEVRL